MRKASYLIERSKYNKMATEKIKKVKETFKCGVRVELVKMADPYTADMVPGIKGTVKKVDDMGTIHVVWDNGHCLGVVLDEDECRIIV